VGQELTKSLKKPEDLKVLARGNPETSIIADVELTLANQYFL
jgi:hypothetical protein